MAAADESAGEGFLARWSRLKREARTGGEAAPAAGPGRAEPAPPPAAAADEEAVDLSALPRLEDLTPASDISAFLRRGVPAALRSAALRRMWSLDPAIRDFVGPADYAWDWNTPGGVPDYVAEIGETPELRRLVERMLCPDPPRGMPDRSPPEAEARRDAAEPARPDLPAAPAALPEPPVGEPPAAAEAVTDPPPPRPRHGGAMPA